MLGLSVGPSIGGDLRLTSYSLGILLSSMGRTGALGVVY